MESNEFESGLMENLKALKDRLKTIDSIIKATNAMKMVSSVKLMKINNKNKFSIASSEILQKMLEATLNEIRFLKDAPENSWYIRDIGKTLIIVLSTDQGFCGSFNQNILNFAKDVISQNPEAFVETFGKKAASIKSPNEIKDKFDIKSFSEALADLSLSYLLNREVAKIIVVFAEFKNVLVQKPKSVQIFPAAIKARAAGKITFEGNIYEIADDLIYKYFLKFFTGCVTGHIFSELSARVMSMDNSVKNAKHMLEDLNVLYNRVRQTKITQELTEIVSSIECVQ